MEFAFDIESVLPGKITVIESRDSDFNLLVYSVELHETQGNWLYVAGKIRDPNVRKKNEALEAIIDALGQASAKAQDLPTPITSIKKLCNSGPQKMYVIRETNDKRCVVGMLKVGVKRLFVCDHLGKHLEVTPLCLLDFYVHTSKQRCGFGHTLFDAMLQNERLDPVKLAIDRPSFNCLAFLAKHYNLREPCQQNNNFVVYPGFLDHITITRPPIFLYNGKVYRRSSFNAATPKATPNKSNISDSLQVLCSVQVPLDGQNVSGYSPRVMAVTPSCKSPRTPRNILAWGNSFTTPRSSEKSSNEKKRSRCLESPCQNKDEKDWSVYDALHGHAKKEEDFNNRNDSSSNRSMTPVNDVTCTPKIKLNQQDSSWNVLGVRPLQYSTPHKRSFE